MDDTIRQIKSLPIGRQSVDRLRQVVRQHPSPGGKMAALQQLISQVDAIRPSSVDLTGDCIRIGVAEDISEAQHETLKAVLKKLRPWRKGPFSVFGVDIDCEWRSDLKWRRLKDHIAPLANRVVLDIGSSSGYYMFRMAAGGPAAILGLEPYPVYYCQYQFLQRFLALDNIFCLPVKDAALTGVGPTFDTIFCMGVLYHSRSPQALIRRQREMLNRGGELVLETLIIEGDDDTCLEPEPRYAKMPNVFHLPTVSRLSRWLSEAGFDGIRCCDVTPTGGAEQRRTPWMPFESLSDFLDPSDPTKTIEGHPAPVRALMLASVE